MAAKIARDADVGEQNQVRAALTHVRARLEYTYDTGCFDTTILAIFRPFSAVFGPFSPS